MRHLASPTYTTRKHTQYLLLSPLDQKARTGSCPNTVCLQADHSPDKNWNTLSRDILPEISCTITFHILNISQFNNFIFTFSLQILLCKFNIHGSVHRRSVHSVETTNKMQPCNRIYYSTVH